MVADLLCNKPEVLRHQLVGLSKHRIKRFFNSEFLDVELAQIVGGCVDKSFDGVVGLGGSC